MVSEGHGGTPVERIVEQIVIERAVIAESNIRSVETIEAGSIRHVIVVIIIIHHHILVFRTRFIIAVIQGIIIQHHFAGIRTLGSVILNRLIILVAFHSRTGRCRTFCNHNHLITWCVVNIVVPG